VACIIICRIISCYKHTAASSMRSTSSNHVLSGLDSVEVIIAAATWRSDSISQRMYYLTQAKTNVNLYTVRSILQFPLQRSATKECIYVYTYVLYRVEPFLGNGRKTNNGTAPITRQQILLMQQLYYKNWRAMFSAWSVPRGCKRDQV
jgi:hypothetical protein